MSDVTEEIDDEIEVSTYPGYRFDAIDVIVLSMGLAYLCFITYSIDLGLTNNTGLTWWLRMAQITSWALDPGKVCLLGMIIALVWFRYQRLFIHPASYELALAIRRRTLLITTTVGVLGIATLAAGVFVLIAYFVDNQGFQAEVVYQSGGLVEDAGIIAAAFLCRLQIQRSELNDA